MVHHGSFLYHVPGLQWHWGDAVCFGTSQLRPLRLPETLTSHGESGESGMEVRPLLSVGKDEPLPPNIQVSLCDRKMECLKDWQVL